MKSEYVSILHRLTTAENKVDERILHILADERTEGEAREPDLGATVHKTLSIWRRRLKANKTAGKPLSGAEALVHQLAAIKPQQSKITQIDFRNEHYACVLFFEWKSGRFIGAVLSERRREATEQEWSSEVGQPGSRNRLHAVSVTPRSRRFFREA